MHNKNITQIIRIKMAKKNIQLILNQTINHLGQTGDVINVTPGYARNYLLPHNIAEPITLGRMKYIKIVEAKNLKIREAKIREMNKMKSEIESINKFSVKRKVSDNDNIFGSVTEKDIVQMLKEITGTLLDKSQINIPEIKKIGIYTVEIELLENLKLEVKLQVLPEILA